MYSISFGLILDSFLLWILSNLELLRQRHVTRSLTFTYPWLTSSTLSWIFARIDSENKNEHTSFRPFEHDVPSPITFVLSVVQRLSDRLSSAEGGGGIRTSNRRPYNGVKSGIVHVGYYVEPKSYYAWNQQEGKRGKRNSIGYTWCLSVSFLPFLCFFNDLSMLEVKGDVTDSPSFKQKNKGTNHKIRENCLWMNGNVSLMRSAFDTKCMSVVAPNHPK